MVRIYDIIRKKRDGLTLTSEEIDYFVQNYTQGKIPDYQISALLMAIFINKLSDKETFDLTHSMAKSGQTIDLSGIKGIKVDKHSTGGVGDKTTLVLLPILASLGLKVCKMSGRGLGHTGGTIDKLESIPGFTTQLSPQQYKDQVNKIGMSVTGQTEDIAPADKKLYALRDVTATVDDISLIASSIMSKKLVSGADIILLDVKVGKGAFVKDLDTARALADTMVKIGNHHNKRTVAVITDMNQPLGRAIGNTLEVMEAIDTLTGTGPNDLLELCIELSSTVLRVVEPEKDMADIRNKILEIINTGQGLDKFNRFVHAQGGPQYISKQRDILPMAQHVVPYKARYSGYISQIDTEGIGIGAVSIGAGRQVKDEKIDYGCGFLLNKKIGDKINKGDDILYIYINDKEKLKPCIDILDQSFVISDKPIEPPKLIYGLVDDKGFHPY
jgi:pyrimidine-nucleoside phosphorylase